MTIPHAGDSGMTLFWAPEEKEGVQICFPTAAPSSRLHCSTKGHARNHWRALHTSSGWGERSQACFCGGPKSARALASSFPPAIVMPAGKRLLCLSQKQQSRQEKKAKLLQRERRGVSVLFNSSLQQRWVSPSTQTAVLRSAE